MGEEHLHHFEAGDSEQGDLLMLAALQRDRVDLSRPSDICCFLDLPSLDQARGAARELRDEGWVTEIEVAPDERTWVIRAEFTLAPTWDNICSMRETMDTVASRHGGAYDGWGIAGPDDG